VTLQADVLLLSRTVITGSVLSAFLMRAPLFPAELPTLIDEACAGRPPIAALTFDADRNLRRYVEALLPPPSFSQKRRVLRLQALPAVTLEYRLPARFKTIPSRPSWQAYGEHERSLGHQGVTEQDAVDASDERRQCGSPFLNQTLTEILAVEV
jgi:hypothetical protein